MICEHKLWTFGQVATCEECGKTQREIDLENTLSEVLACFRDEDVTVTVKMKERWHNVLDDKL